MGELAHEGGRYVGIELAVEEDRPFGLGKLRRDLGEIVERADGGGRHGDDHAAAREFRPRAGLGAKLLPLEMRRFPELSRSDVQFCTLYRMNLTTKEISALLHIEPRSVYLKKYRIMEKMKLGEGDDFDGVVFE